MSIINYTIKWDNIDYAVAIGDEIFNNYPLVVESAKRSIATFLAQSCIDLMELSSNSTETNTPYMILVSLGINNPWPIIYMEPPENYIIDSVWPKQTLDVFPSGLSDITRDDNSDGYTLFEIVDESVPIHVWYHPESLRPTQNIF